MFTNKIASCFLFLLYSDYSQCKLFNLNSFATKMITLLVFLSNDKVFIYHPLNQLLYLFCVFLVCLLMIMTTYTSQNCLYCTHKEITQALPHTLTKKFVLRSHKHIFKTWMKFSENSYT